MLICMYAAPVLMRHMYMHLLHCVRERDERLLVVLAGAAVRPEKSLGER